MVDSRMGRLVVAARGVYIPFAANPNRIPSCFQAPIAGHLGRGTALVSPLQLAEKSGPTRRRETRSSWEMPLIADGAGSQRIVRRLDRAPLTDLSLLSRLNSELSQAIAPIVLFLDAATYLSSAPSCRADTASW